MEKHAMASAPYPDIQPQAPPTYEEAVQRQPAFNPQAPYAAAPPVQQVVMYPPPVPVSGQVLVPHVPLAVGPKAATLECPHCHKRVRTVISTEYQKGAHIAALVLCLCVCWVCCCIPYCMSSFKNVHHKCPECKGFIGTYKH